MVTAGLLMVCCGVGSVVMLGMLGSAGAVCEVWESVPGNHHMCYSVQGEEEVEVVRDVLRKKWVLEEPANCKSPFPCFGVVREVVEVEKVPQIVTVCQLEPVWRQPRPIRETYNGVTLVLSPGYFQERNFSSQLMCVWNITCAENQALFVNYTGSDPPSSESDDCAGEYVVLEWEEGREVRCINHLGQSPQNHIFTESIKVVFQSQARGTFGRGLRLDTACYEPTEPLPGGNCTSQPHSPSQSHESLVLGSVEESQLSQMFYLHLQLHMLRAACSHSVQECGEYYRHHLNQSLRRQLEELAGAPDTCSALLLSLHSRTLSMYGY